MAKVLITGAVGTLGSRLVEELTSDGQNSHKLTVAGAPVAVDNCEGIEVVVHLETEAGPATTRKLLEAASEAGVSQFIAASSTVVYGAWPQNAVPLGEDSPLRPNPGVTFAIELAEQERVLSEWRALHPGGMKVCVLRYAMVANTGMEQALVSSLGQIDWHRHPDASRLVQFLHVDDAASATGFAIDNELDGVFNVAPSDFVADAKARAIAGGPPRPALPRRVAHLANDILWRRRWYRSDFRSDFQVVSDYFEHPWVVSSDKLRKQGWSPAYTSEEAIATDAKPTLWNRLRPQQRRDLVSGSLATGALAGTAATIGGTLLLILRKKRQR